MADAGIYQIAEACKNRTSEVCFHRTHTPSNIILIYYPSIQEPLSRVPAAQSSELKTALHNFSLWLSGLEVVQSPRLQHLTVQRLHTQIHQAALERMARAYKVICEEVKRPENRYEAASTLLGSERPFGQAHLLWQIFGLEDSEDV